MARRKIAKRARGRRQGPIGPVDDVPTAHDRQVFYVQADKPSARDFRGDRVRGNESDPHLRHDRLLDRLV